MNGTEEPSGSEIAIVGMAGRFPGAPDPDSLWRRIARGDDCLVDLDPGELRARGVDLHSLTDPQYVPRAGVLDDVDCFDADFFGIGSRDAAIMDPQHRLFYECAWEALESAGHVPERFGGSIGVFAGCGMNTYLVFNLLTNPELVKSHGLFLLRHTANDKDFLSTGLSYRLDLRGPSINVQTACSTSLVAVHLAAQSLVALECDLALAGGVTVEVPHGVGYTYQEGEILARDGRCRAFDVASTGTVLTSGVGVVALRRLADARRDGDPILAVLRGSAVNNDGARKVGYLAPSVDGHVDVVREALAVAGVSARSITLLESHGTGTAVGDPIEFSALTEAFQADTADTEFCRLVSTKPNIGHLDTAAGVASLIKVVQALRHRWLPPLANLTAPSSSLALDRSPFVISGEGSPWAVDGIRRAGISSLGVGGTNAHVIVEEAPQTPAPSLGLSKQLLVLSARNEAALNRMTLRLADHLEGAVPTVGRPVAEQGPDGVPELADVAYTLAMGRRTFAHRRAVVASDAADALKQLRLPDRRRRVDGIASEHVPRVVFLFPGGGSQYVGMGAGLDSRFSAFHEARAEGIAAVRQECELDLAPLLRADVDPETLAQPVVSLLSIFVTEVALARLYMDLGVHPAALVGHSLGEYTAAVLAEVLSFEDAIRLIATRAELMARVGGKRAAMMTVALSETELVGQIGPGVSLAAVNGLEECVVSGSAPEIEALARQLRAAGVSIAPIPLAAAAHSDLLDPVLDEFANAMRGVTLSPPTRPFISNLTGDWITPAQATDPAYWVAHLRGTVRFADGLRVALAKGDAMTVELGPGHALTSCARRQAVRPVDSIASLRHPNDKVDDTVYSLAALGRAWCAGAPVDLARLTGPGSRRRLRLPTYPFDRTRHWVDPGTPQTPPPVAQPGEVTKPQESLRRRALEDWGSAPEWVPAPPAPMTRMDGEWAVVGDARDPVAEAVADALGAQGAAVIRRPNVESVTAAISGIVVVGPAVCDELGTAASRWLDDAANAARLLGARVGATRLVLVTRDATDADGSRPTRPLDALAFGVGRVAPQEYENLSTLVVDLPRQLDSPTFVSLAGDILGGTGGGLALRNGTRLTPVLRSIALGNDGDRPEFVTGGTYVVTGGLGGIGSSIARWLIDRYQAHVVVVGSEPMPDDLARQAYLDTHTVGHPRARRMRRLAALELAASDVGASVMFTSADLADPTSVASILDDVFARVGAVDGVIHAAGRLLDRPIELLSHDDAMSVLGARTTAALALTAESARRSIGLVVLIGSTSAILAPAGQTSYVASNAVLGALAGQVGPTRVVTVDFGVWAGTGMSADILRRQRLGDGDETFDHPVFNRGRNRRDGGYELFGELAAEDWLVAEHRLADGTRVLSGSGHLALYLGALEAVGMDPFVLEDLTLLAPVAVADGATVALRLTIDPPGGAYRRVALDADGGTGREWLSSSEAIIKPRAEEQAADASLDPETFPPASALSKTTTTQVLARPSRRLRLGPRWSVDSALGSSDEVPTESARVVRARLRLAKPFRSESRPWLAHPALVDVATAVAVSLTPDRSEVLYLPVRYGAVSHKVRHLDEVLLEVQVVATDAGAIVQLHFSDPHGVGVLEVRDLELVALEGPLRVDGPLTPLIEHDQPSSLVDLADELGIRADDGPEALDRALARGLPHVILSSVALDLLSQLQTRRERAPKHDGAHGSLQTRLAGWWEEFLGIPVGPDDDFFEVGGHSLIAIRVLARVHREIGVRLPIAAFFDAPTVRTLSALIEAEGRLGEVPSFLQADVNRASLREATTSVANRPAAIVVPMRASGTKRPLFIVHGAGGNVMNLWGFARNLPKDRPVYAFQAVGADGVESPDESVEAMAARYVQALISIQPDGPCLIAGYSGGGIVALEISRQLAEVGRTTSLVVLIDTPLPGDWYLALLPQLVRATRTAFRDGPMAVAPWVRHKASRLAVHMHLRRPNARERAMTEVYTDVERIGLVNLELPFAEMVSRYVIRSYPTNALLVKAKVDLAVQTSTYGWDSYIEGRLDTITVTGSHQSMFMSEHVGELAAAVESYLVLSDAEALSSSADERC